MVPTLSGSICACGANPSSTDWQQLKMFSTSRFLLYYRELSFAPTPSLKQLNGCRIHTFIVCETYLHDIHNSGASGVFTDLCNSGHITVNPHCQCDWICHHRRWQGTPVVCLWGFRECVTHPECERHHPLGYKSERIKGEEKASRMRTSAFLAQQNVCSSYLPCFLHYAGLIPLKP